MELKYDWRSFQSVFYPQNRALQASKILEHPAVFAVVEAETLVSVYGNGESFSDFVGSPISTLKSALGGRELIVLEREKVDEWANSAIALSHLHEQVEFFRQSVAPQLGEKASSTLQKSACLSERHFLIDSLLGGWSKVLPSAFGVFIRLERAASGTLIPLHLQNALGPRSREYLEQEQDILVLIRNGKLEAFYEPDLSPMGAERRHLGEEVVKYLSEKHSVRIQGISVSYVEWMGWTHAGKPWSQMANSLRSRKAKLFPMRWSLAGMLGVLLLSELGS